MKLTSLSASKINTFLECPLKYKLRYHDGIKPPKTTDAADFGSWLHKGFELSVKNGRDIREILKEEMNNYSFSKTFLKNVPTILRNFKRVNDQLEKGSTEISFSIHKETSVPVRGIIDRIVTKNGKILVIDYKTGKVQKNRNSIKKDIQLLMYSYAASNLLNVEPNNIHLALFYVLSGDILDISYTNKEVISFINYLNQTSEEIKNMDPEKAKPRIQKWCSSCEYQCDSYLKYKALRKR